MPRKALSATKKAQLQREERDRLMARAVLCYQQGQDNPGQGRKPSLRTVCRDLEKEYYLKKHQRITLNHNTLRNLVNGGRMRSEVNAEKSWLQKEEVKEVIDYTIEMAEWGHPFSHRRLKEHVDAIVRARLSPKFPETGVGKQWTYRFLEKHSDKLHMYVAHPLDAARGQAVNEYANGMYFDIVEKVQLRGDDGNPIAPECTFALDEAGFQANGDEGFEQVIGAKGKKVQYQQQKGTRENITVLVTICADGTAVPPAVIFKGKAYLVKWHQDNPAKASLGYSKKGWTNRIIGLEGRTRALYVDGHDSHVTREFIEHCRTNKILVPSYPAHSTHVYQSLDVGIFGPLKQEYGKRRDQHLRETGEAITKENFLKIYGEAHLKVLTPDLIQAAFQKVGIFPFNRNVVTPEMMAPSRDTSYKVFTPIIPSTPVRIVSELLVDAIQPPVNESANQGSSGLALSPSRLVRMAVPQLASSDACFMTSSSPIRSSSEPPDLQTMELSPIKRQMTTNNHLLTMGTAKERETQLREALLAKQAQIDFLKGQVLQQQATMVLQRLYCARVRRQLAAKERKVDKNGKKGGKLLGDGLPHLLTDDEFYERIKAHWEAVEVAELEQAARKQKKLDLAAELESWKKDEAERKKRNKDLDALWKTAIADWETRKAGVKASSGKIKDWMQENPRPKKSDPEFKQEKAIPKPKLRKSVAMIEQESDGEEFESPDVSDDEE
ncbi:hypothetical protein M378DRAFT_1034675 [Amanita muscaria Koide BX008]|uniref:DDE-1 domain-containing protein n=1 Tax=Amanita muscaria (strain Koide BX008) TaxID=946122 RepID=A0A0C2SR67_AMAMK|nr:hypothetical protein M378DRAFT_1034675 [Amanita muscaria Koide BX008]